jgi:hypothetical protein
MLLHSFTSWLAFASVTFALPRAEPLASELVTRQDGECVNTARTRQCWSNGYSIDTDFDAKRPPDGVEVPVSSLYRDAEKVMPNVFAGQSGDYKHHDAQP